MKILKTLLFFAALAASTPLQAQTSDDSLHVVDEIVITGSRLKMPTHHATATIPQPLRINLKNILSSQYETGGFGASPVIPATPFTLKATIGYSL